MKTFLRRPFLHMSATLLLCLLMTHCKTSGNDVRADHKITDYAEEYSVKLNEESRMPVSDHLMGFNLVYSNEEDAIWQDGKIEGYLRDVNTSILRYPGGTISTFYHWNTLEQLPRVPGSGWRDSWDPENPVSPSAGSEFMDLDEYMELIQNTGATPVLGINLSSGWRWDRLEDGVNEALDLIRYCREQNFNVRYWYLDNEPYQHDSNGGEKTIEEYAELINLFASRMREVDPDIKTIANWPSAFDNRRSEYQTLLEIAGDNIDIIDTHRYWSWNNPNMEFWLSHTPTRMWTGDTYIEEIAYFRQMVTDFGYPDIQLASLEWNVGPIDEDQLTPHQAALIQAELMMQFIIGGLDMASFWPLHWSSRASEDRSFVVTDDNHPNPVYHIFKFLGQIQGSSVIGDEVTRALPHVLNFVAIDEEEGVLRVCLLNKNDINVRVTIESGLFGDLILLDAQAFILTGGGNSSGMKPVDLLEHTSEGVSFVAFDTSISMLTFKEK